MNVPLLDLSRHHAPLRTELLAAFERVLDANAFVLGEEVSRLEAGVALLTGAGHAVGVSSGTDALLVSLTALGVGPGDEVITTPYSFFATAGTVTRLGARPVFVDIDPATFNLDPRLVERAVTARTRAILPVHLFGQCAEMDPVLDIAARRKLAVVEDAAQAIGAAYRGSRRAGSLGDFGCFSFYPTKNLGGAGDGGLVTCRDPGHAELVRRLRNHGSTSRYVHGCVGGNFRLDALQAAFLNVKLGRLEGWSRARRENAGRYREMMSKAGLVGRIGLPREAYDERDASPPHIYNQFVIRTPNRDALRDHLTARGVGTEIYYPIPFHLQPCYRDLGLARGAYPEAERAAAETLALPVFPEMTADQQAWVVDSIRTFFAP